MASFVLDADLTNDAYEHMPYAKFIGLQAGRFIDEEKHVFKLPFKEMLIGNVMVNALHGGLIGGFMESCATLFLKNLNNIDYVPKVIDFSIDYLRPGRAEDLYAECALTRQGSRIAFVRINAWQGEYVKPIAKAKANFLLRPTE